MKAETLVELLADQPFVPVRVHLADGRSHVIMHPELAIVGEDAIVIGTRPDDSPGVAKHIHHCSIRQITEAHQVKEPKTNGS